MSERFFSAEPITSQRVTLDGPEAHHLLHVMRAAVGQQVTLFDGQGAEFAAEVTVCGRASVDLAILERFDMDRELPFALVVGVSLPKGDRQKWLAEKLTELGATELVPLVTERGIAQPTAGALERLERSVIEAAKQCGRNRLMRIAAPHAWGEWIVRRWLGSSVSEPPVQPYAGGSTMSRPLPHAMEMRRLVAHPAGRPLVEFDLSSQQSTLLAIGPEGGLTDAEIATAAAAGWQTVDLGRRILRVETAAVALAAVVALQFRP
jgi:16S rRNA (uracil1498-N3)-methyltransferase